MRNPLTYEDIETGKAQRTGHGWLHFKEWDMAIIAPPKSGSSSLKQFIWMHELGDSVQKISCHIGVNHLRCKKYAVVRNPYERFASLWKSKCRDKMPIRDASIHGLSPRALAAYISSGKKDPHWATQSELIGDTTDVELIPLEKLNEWWKGQGYGELIVFNSTEGEMQMNEMIHTWLCQFYAEDFILYSKACGFS